MKRVLYLVPLLLLAAVFIWGCESPLSPDVEDVAAQAAGKLGDKLDVCHKRDDQGYILINIAEPAYQTHVDHGDGPIGGSVPEMAGFVFDENCVPVDPPVTCPCFTADMLAPIDWSLWYSIDGGLEMLESYIPPGQEAAAVCFGVDRGPCGSEDIICGTQVGTVIDSQIISLEQALACKQLLVDEATAEPVEEVCTSWERCGLVLPY